jgi:DMSO/TMAO reductase YedYZ heme-binding membrane subunit
VSAASGRARSRALIIGAVAVALVASLWLHPQDMSTIEYYGHALRVTARIAFTFFMLAYVARPLVEVTGGGGWLVRNRRYLGLAAAIAHSVHFGYIVAYFEAIGEVPDLGVASLGGGAFVALWAMAATSNNTSVRALGPWWKRLHRFGMHYLWVVFVYTFAGRIAETPGYWLFVAIGLAGLALRIVAALKKRSASRARAVSAHVDQRSRRTG